MSEYTGEKTLPITDWSMMIEHDAYLDPNPLKLQEEVDIYRQERPNEWVHIKTIFVHGVELTEYGKYWLDEAIADYRRSLPEYKAHIRAKRRRKIERRQKRAAFRRLRRGMA
jgi:hypothetical protein